MLSQILPSLIYLIPILLIIALVKSPWFKGKIGEWIVSLANYRLGADYKKIDNVTLQLQDGTTQIDHIIVSRYGIFVIETKNYKGWIYGNEREKNWTQNIFGKKNSFPNPLHQNYRHIKGLEELLGISDIHSIIVFVGDCTFKSTMPDNIFKDGRYISYIKSFNKVVFSDKEVLDMENKINNLMLKRGYATDREHVRSVNSRINYKKDPKITCARCGSVMTERKNRKTGEVFLGCSNYPKCRNTELL